MFTLISVLDVVMKFLFLRYKFPCVEYIQIQVLCTFKYHQIQLLRLIKLGEGVYIPHSSWESFYVNSKRLVVFWWRFAPNVPPQQMFFLEMFQINMTSEPHLPRILKGLPRSLFYIDHFSISNVVDVIWIATSCLCVPWKI